MMRFAQKIQKYHVAEQHDYQSMPSVFYHNGQIHPDAVKLVHFQIDHKLRLADGKSMPAKINSIWRLWVRHISTAIYRAASRNIQHEIFKMINVSNAAQRKTASSSSCERASSSTSKLAEELEQYVGVLLLDQDVYQSQHQYAGDQFFDHVAPGSQGSFRKGSDVKNSQDHFMVSFLGTYFIFMCNVYVH